MSVSVGFANYVVAALKADPVVAALVGDKIVDGPTPDMKPPYISLGPSNFVLHDADCINSREETLQIDCWTAIDGKKWPCKQIVDAVVKVARKLDGDIAGGIIVGVSVPIAQVVDDPDGITAHGIVQISAMIDEESDDG